MDPITHGIAGALIGKAFFAERGPTQSEQAGRVATISATLGSIFPDVDVGAELLSTNDLAILQIHRNVTHSFLCLPVFAVALAALTRWYARRRGWETPSWAALTVIYTVGLASHILLDLATSFGTMIWSPWNHTRATWDLVFIIDFAMTAIVLLPQTAAWVYRERERGFQRAWGLWIFFTACMVLIAWLAQAVGFGFSPWTVVIVPLVLLALFFLPMWRGWGFRVRRSSWCRAGVYALVAYFGICAAAHRAALQRVEEFAASQHLRVGRLGALPLPPSAAYWEGLIRTSDGVWKARINVWNGLFTGRRAEKPPAFLFIADSAPNGYLEAAEQLPKVKTYLWFARFPVFRFLERDDQAVVEVSDLRFFSRRTRPTPFTFRVTFDAQGHVIDQGWARTVR
jgi:membrane-bound metal-dependent hydrolase YbcI (DUF457 family)